MMQIANSRIRLMLVVGQLLGFLSSVRSFSMSMNSAMNLMNSDSSKLDRFQSVCWVGGTESQTVVEQFDSSLWSSLYSTGETEDTWVAVYRSNNNKPSVIVRDDFFGAMNEATSGAEKSDDTNDNTQNLSTVSSAASFMKNNLPMLEVPSSKPVAIARLKKTSEDNVYLLDNLRCALKKEDQDASCDGGSEFVEALSVAVDTLLLQHLQQLLQKGDDKANEVVFEGTVRTKSTLFSNKLFEQRGFQEVETLSLDMATHVSSYEACFSQYAERSIAASIAQGTRDRALQIVALLGKLDPVIQNQAQEDNKDDDYDPWANMQIYRS